MKKYIPLFLLIFLFSFYLVGQGFLNMSNPKATLLEDKKKQNISYEEAIKRFKERDIEGREINLKRMPKVLILNFWASWCTPCLEEFPSLNRLYSKFQKKGLRVIAINTDEKDQLKKIDKIKKRYDLKFDIILDKKSHWINQFNIDAIPVSLIFFKGKIQEVSHGAKDFDSGEFKERVEQWIKD